MGRQRVPAALLLVALALCAAPTMTAADHKVYINWLAHGNYTGWGESHGPFTQGDWLVFYNPDQLLVAMVDESGYHRCDSTHASFKYNKSQEIAISLDPQTYYFISDFDNCRGGMHLVIEAKLLPPPTPSGGSARGQRSAAATVPGRRRTTSLPSSDSERQKERQGRGMDRRFRWLRRRSEAIKETIESS